MRKPKANKAQETQTFKACLNEKIKIIINEDTSLKQ
jgi:hypothetical protein